MTAKQHTSQQPNKRRCIAHYHCIHRRSRRAIAAMTNKADYIGLLLSGHWICSTSASEVVTKNDLLTMNIITDYSSQALFKSFSFVDRVWLNTAKDCKGPTKDHKGALHRTTEDRQYRKGPQRSITQDHRGSAIMRKLPDLQQFLFNFWKLFCLYFL